MKDTRNKIDSSTTKNIEIVLNRYLSKKYDWFDKIKIDTIGYSPGANGHFAPDGVIFVDKDWLYEKWREYHYEGPFPDLEDEDLEISLGDFIGGTISQELRDVFISVFTAVTSLPRPKYISWSWLRVKTKENKEEDLRESIRKVLKENKVKDRLEKLIDKVGFHKASKSVGGVRTIAKVMGMNVAELLNTYFVGEELSTDDMKDTGMEVGGYDFKFTPTYVSEKNERIVFNYAITEGRVTLIAGTGETFDLMDDKLRNKDYWWEVEYEIIDLFILYSIWLLEDLNYEDKEEMLTPSVEFYFRPKI